MSHAGCGRARRTANASVFEPAPAVRRRTAEFWTGCPAGLKSHGSPDGGRVPFLATLERLAGARRDSPAAKEALAFLKNLRQRIRPDLAHYLRQVGGERHGAGYWSFSRTDNAWSGEDYRRQRRAIAEMIAKLSR